jgi:hypothetical protein
MSLYHEIREKYLPSEKKLEIFNFEPFLKINKKEIKKFLPQIISSLKGEISLSSANFYNSPFGVFKNKDEIIVVNNISSYFRFKEFNKMGFKLFGFINAEYVDIENTFYHDLCLKRLYLKFLELKTQKRSIEKWVKNFGEEFRFLDKFEISFCKLIKYKYGDFKNLNIDNIETSDVFKIRKFLIEEILNQSRLEDNLEGVDPRLFKTIYYHSENIITLKVGTDTVNWFKFVKNNKGYIKISKEKPYFKIKKDIKKRGLDFFHKQSQFNKKIKENNKQNQDIEITRCYNWKDFMYLQLIDDLLFSKKCKNPNCRMFLPSKLNGKTYRGKYCPNNISCKKSRERERQKKSYYKKIKSIRK